MVSKTNLIDIEVSTKQKTRLDRYLRRIFSDLTQGLIEKSLRQKKILLNGQKATANNFVQAPDIISYKNNLLTIRYAKEDKLAFPNSTISLAKKILADLNLFSNDQFIAINKPHGLATQGGSKINLSIDHALSFLNYTTNQQYKLVHRLDKDTSGILLIAKGYEAAQNLTSAFKNNLIFKKYVALVVGNTIQKEGTLINYLKKIYQNDLGIIQEAEDGKKAETMFKLIKYNQEQNISLLHFFPKTGRMHQLRFHAKFLNCPILGDMKYGNHRANRLYLHAQEITIHSKIFGEQFNITAPLPADFNKLIDK